MGKSWPDPQFNDGKLSALNIDPKSGLPIVKPSKEEIAGIVKCIKDNF